MPGEYASFAMRAVSLGRKRGRPPVLSANAFYPFAAERRLASLLKEELSRSIRESLAASLGRISDDGEEDGWTEGFLSGTERAASEIVLNAREAFSRFSEMTVGTPYYPPDVEERVKDDWKAEFLACCRSADADAKADIARALTEAKERGWNRAQAEAAVLERLDPKYAKRAELIARTETGKLNNAATMATYRSAGVEYYVWLATPDERTRPSHAALNGKICAVGDPDSWYEDNPDDPLRPVAHGRGKDMYHGDPGTDFQCRCTSIPWDPRIDSKYRVRKVPEPERKPSELETAREEAEKARGELEEARKREKKAAEAMKKAKETALKAEAERIAAEKVAEKALEEARRSRLEAAAVKRHATRTTEKENEIAQRRTDRIERTKKYSSLIGLASGIGVSSNPVKRLVGHLSSDAIVSRLAGGDLTKGSCSSLAIAYAANRKGLDVLDFRGGESLRVFSLMENIMRLAEVGGYVMQDYNGYTLAHRLISLVQPGKEYYFTSGAHAAIVRKSGTVYEFLELQDPETARNGFKPLTVEQLKSRFGTKKSWTADESKLMFTEVLVDIDKMTDSPKFKELVGFINTEAGKQQKGATGNTK